MAGKNVKPAAKSKGAPGEATKRSDTTSLPEVKVDQASNAGQQEQLGGKNEGAPGEATKLSDTTSLPEVKVDQASNAGQQEQLDGKNEAAHAGQVGNLVTNRHLMIDLQQLRADVARSSSIGNQEQPGTPAAGSAAASEPAQPGAGQNCFADSSPKSIPGLAVTSSRDGFWRCGRQWTKAEQKIALADLTDEEADLIINEPMLTVGYVDLAAQA